MDALRDELLKDPKGLGYANLGDVAASEVLTKRNRQRLTSVSRAGFAIWAAQGPRAVIEDVALAVGNPLRASALTLRDFLAGAAEELDLTELNVKRLFQSWREAGCISADEYRGLVDLATTTCSRAEELGLTDASANAVMEARK